jgi:hypothetical protein
MSSKSWLGYICPIKIEERMASKSPLGANELLYNEEKMFSNC